MRRLAERPIELGDVVVVALGRHVPPGHEQEGYRPAVVVGMPERVGEPRYPIVVVAPLTTQSGDWVASSPELYLRLAAGTAGLPRDSIVLLDNVRAVDASRVIRYLGSLSDAQLAPMRGALQRMIGTTGPSQTEGEAPAAEPIEGILSHDAKSSNDLTPEDFERHALWGFDVGLFESIYDCDETWVHPYQLDEAPEWSDMMFLRAEIATADERTHTGCLIFRFADYEPVIDGFAIMSPLYEAYGFDSNGIADPGASVRWQLFPAHYEATLTIGERTWHFEGTVELPPLEDDDDDE